MRYYLEICSATPQSIDAAYEGGADRIELCSGLEMGGLTPSKGLLDYALSKRGLPVHVLIRPRPGDFIYSPAEMKVIVDDIAWARKSGAAGIVCGALTPEGLYDIENLNMMIQAAKPLPFTFHRGVDHCCLGLEKLDILIEMGVTRILTSGGAPSAMEGAASLNEMIKHSKGKLQIMAGGGIDQTNILELIMKSGVQHIHMSAKRTVESQAFLANVGTQSITKTRAHFESDLEIVRASRMALDKLSNEPLMA